MAATPSRPSGCARSISSPTISGCLCHICRRRGCIGEGCGFGSASALSRNGGRKRRWSLDEPTPFEAVRTLDPEPDPYVLNRAQNAVIEAFPLFRDVAIAERWGGMIDVMPDAIPVISPVDSLPGFFIATGFSGHGFGIGPGAGKLVADMVAGDPTLVDPAPFRLTRFTDGSNPQPHPLAS